MPTSVSYIYCIPYGQLRISSYEVFFYCHFPDKLLAKGEFVEGKMKMGGSLLKRAYRFPWMGWRKLPLVRLRCVHLPVWRSHLKKLGNADIILANSSFTSRVFKAYFPSISQGQEPRVVHPGINLLSYEPPGNCREPDITMVSSYVRRPCTCFACLMLVSDSQRPANFFIPQLPQPFREREERCACNRCLRTFQARTHGSREPQRSAEPTASHWW